MAVAAIFILNLRLIKNLMVSSRIKGNATEEDLLFLELLADNNYTNYNAHYTLVFQK
jgi:hypothetical protein